MAEEGQGSGERINHGGLGVKLNSGAGGGREKKPLSLPGSRDVKGYGVYM